MSVPECQRCGGPKVKGRIWYCPPCRAKRGRAVGLLRRYEIGGRQFGRLTAQSYAGNGNWSCLCICGVEVVVQATILVNDRTVSCGCYAQEQRTKHGYAGTAIYAIWMALRQRCKNPNNPNYYKYGGRGITVCLGWDTDVAVFVKDMGERPEGYSIERRNNGSGYWCGHCEECLANGWPANCYWATPAQQALNTRRNALLTLNGKTQPLKAWADELDANEGTLRSRRMKGWTDEEVLLGQRKAAEACCGKGPYER